MMKRVLMLCMGGTVCFLAMEAEAKVNLKAAIQSGISKIQNSAFGQSKTGQALFSVAQAVGSAAKTVGRQVAVDYTKTTLIPAIRQEAKQIRTNVVAMANQYWASLQARLQQLRNSGVDAMTSQITNASNAINTLITNLDTIDSNIDAWQQQQQATVDPNTQAQIGAVQQQLEAQKQSIVAQLQQFIAAQINALNSLKAQLQSLNDVQINQTIDVISSLTSAVTDLTALKSSLDAVCRSVFADTASLKAYIQSLNLKAIAQNVYAKLAATPQAMAVQNFVNNVRNLDNVDSLGAATINTIGTNVVNKINAYGATATTPTMVPMSNTGTAVGTVPTVTVDRSLNMVPMANTTQVVGTVPATGVVQTIGTVPMTSTIQTTGVVSTSNTTQTVGTVPASNTTQTTGTIRMGNSRLSRLH